MKPEHRYEVILYWSDADQVFLGEVPESPGCAADGPTYAARQRAMRQRRSMRGPAMQRSSTPRSGSSGPPSSVSDGAAARIARPPALGNPQIANARADAPVQAYIAALPGWKAASMWLSCALAAARATPSNATQRCTVSRARVCSSVSMLSRIASDSLSFAAPHFILSHPVRRRQKTRAVSTCAKATNPTSLNSVRGLSRRASCRVTCSDAAFAISRCHILVP